MKCVRSAFWFSSQQSIEGLQRRCKLYCVLKTGQISCYYSPEEIQAKVEPSLIIPINKVKNFFKMAFIFLFHIVFFLSKIKCAIMFEFKI